MRLDSGNRCWVQPSAQRYSAVFLCHGTGNGLRFRKPLYRPFREELAQAPLCQLGRNRAGKPAAGHATDRYDQRIRVIFTEDAGDGHWLWDSVQGALLSNRDQNLLPEFKVCRSADHLPRGKPSPRLLRAQGSLPAALAPLSTSSLGATVKDSSFEGPVSVVVTSIAA